MNLLSGLISKAAAGAILATVLFMASAPAVAQDGGAALGTFGGERSRGFGYGWGGGLYGPIGGADGLMGGYGGPGMFGGFGGPGLIGFGAGMGPMIYGLGYGPFPIAPFGYGNGYGNPDLLGAGAFSYSRGYSSAPSPPPSVTAPAPAPTASPYPTGQFYEPGDGYRYPLYYDPVGRTYLYYPVGR